MHLKLIIVNIVQPMDYETAVYWVHES